MHISNYKYIIFGKILPRASLLFLFGYCEDDLEMYFVW